MSVFSLHHLEWRNLLCTKLMSLHKKAALCDTRLHVSDSDCHLWAHGCVLSAASPVLLSQLEHDDDHLCLPADLNYPCHVWQCLLQFIYSGTVTLASVSQAAEVQEAAETLELQMLVNLCEHYVQRMGSVEDEATNTPHTTSVTVGNIDMNASEHSFDNNVCTSEAVAGADEHKWAGTRPDNVSLKCSVIDRAQSASRRESSRTMLPCRDQSQTLQNKLKVPERGEEKNTLSLPDAQCVSTRSCDETELMSSAEASEGQGRTDVDSQQKVEVNQCMHDAEQAGTCLGVTGSNEANSQPPATSRRPSTLCQPSTCAGEDVSTVTTQTQGQPDVRGRTTGQGRTSKRPLACPQCGKLFAHPSVLLIHSRKHTGDRPFVCVVCGRAFSQSGALKGHHQRVHTNHRPYECITCGKTFAHKSDVQVHQRVHTGVRPYMCPECGNTFARQTDLSSHRRCHQVDNILARGTCG